MYNNPYNINLTNFFIIIKNIHQLNLIPFYITGTGNLRLLSGSSLSGTGFFIPDSVSGRNRVKELTNIPAGILMDLFALKLEKIRAPVVYPSGSSNFSGGLRTVKSIN